MAEVVIVGAGPVGLWLASELHLQGISVSIVEKKREPDGRSRAVSVHFWQPGSQRPAGTPSASAS